MLQSIPLLTWYNAWQLPRPGSIGLLQLQIIRHMKTLKQDVNVIICYFHIGFCIVIITNKAKNPPYKLMFTRKARSSPKWTLLLRSREQTTFGRLYEESTSVLSQTFLVETPKCSTWSENNDNQPIGTALYVYTSGHIS